MPVTPGATTSDIERALSIHPTLDDFLTSQQRSNPGTRILQPVVSGSHLSDASGNARFVTGMTVVLPCAGVAGRNYYGTVGSVSSGVATMSPSPTLTGNLSRPGAVGFDCGAQMQLAANNRVFLLPRGVWVKTAATKIFLGCNIEDQYISDVWQADDNYGFAYNPYPETNLSGIEKNVCITALRLGGFRLHAWNGIQIGDPYADAVSPNPTPVTGTCSIGSPADAFMTVTASTGGTSLPGTYVGQWLSLQGETYPIRIESIAGTTVNLNRQAGNSGGLTFSIGKAHEVFMAGSYMQGVKIDTFIQGCYDPLNDPDYGEPNFRVLSGGNPQWTYDSYGRRLVTTPLKTLADMLPFGTGLYLAQAINLEVSSQYITGFGTNIVSDGCSNVQLNGVFCAGGGRHLYSRWIRDSRGATEGDSVVLRDCKFVGGVTRAPIMIEGCAGLLIENTLGEFSSHCPIVSLTPGVGFNIAEAGGLTLRRCSLSTYQNTADNPEGSALDLHPTYSVTTEQSNIVGGNGMMDIGMGSVKVFYGPNLVQSIADASGDPLVAAMPSPPPGTPYYRKDFRRSSTAIRSDLPAVFQIGISADSIGTGGVSWE